MRPVVSELLALREDGRGRTANILVMGLWGGMIASRELSASIWAHGSSQFYTSGLFFSYFILSFLLR